MTPKDFYSSNDIVRVHKGHYFARDTMRFFSSRVLSQVFPGKDEVYFVTSERNRGVLSGINYERKCTVRAYNPVTDKIRTVPPFNKLTRSRALRIARDLAETI